MITFTYSSGIYGKPPTLTLKKGEEQIVIEGPYAMQYHSSLMQVPKEIRPRLADEIWKEEKERRG